MKDDQRSLLIIGGVLLVVFVIGHVIAYSQFVPNLPAIWAFHGLWLRRFISFAGVFVGGLLLSIVHWLYYRWTAWHLGFCYQNRRTSKR
jgi:hypothetical protein